MCGYFNPIQRQLLLQNKGVGKLRYAAPASKPNDYICLRAEMNVVVAMSACPNDKLEVWYNSLIQGMQSLLCQVLHLFSLLPWKKNYKLPSSLKCCKRF